MKIRLAADYAREGYYKTAISQLTPTQLYTRIYNNSFLPDETRIQHDRVGWCITDSTEDTISEIYLTQPTDAILYRNKSISDRLEKLRDKYQLEGFVEVEDGDTVIDIGSFIGEFSLSHAPRAGRIIAFEPDSRNYRTLQLNANRFSNIEAKNTALWHTDSDIDFNEADDGTESGISTPDRGSASKSTTQAKRLESVIDEPIDFAKVEAEGVELEIIAGFGELDIRKIAVDCTEPRGPDGDTPERLIKELLETRGYDVRITGDDRPMLFAVQ